MHIRPSLPSRVSHKNFFRFKARDNYELGKQLGETFKDQTHIALNRAKASKTWNVKIEHAKKYISPVEQDFPHYIKELQGYAESAGVSFVELWSLCLEDELEYYRSEKCTTVIANNGFLISHNEDWDENAKDMICLLQKSVHDITIVELFYCNTLGGNSISINSHGIVQSINSLTHSDWQIGVPRNVVARWLSETKDPNRDYERLKSLHRSMGYNHCLIDQRRKIHNIECTSQRQELTQPYIPYIHTNHYLGSLKEFEATQKDENSSTFNRYDKATAGVKPLMSTQEIITLNSDSSDGRKMSIFNERTIGKMVVDLKHKRLAVWLKSEEEKGWVDYDIED